MSKEREQIIADIVKELESINNISVVRFILNIVKSFKANKKWGAQYDE